ncbi:MAG: vWA domain-containing protein [Solirubrobacterales bacterium]
MGAWSYSADSAEALCSANPEVALIVDDSGSMSYNDPKGIRIQALGLLLSKSSNWKSTFGAVEFGTNAAPLFGPGEPEDDFWSMAASFDSLQNDGSDGEDGTNYNRAFSVSNYIQPGADARIFLTDGENDGKFRMSLVHGVPTYVIGLDIGPAKSSPAARQLKRIAAKSKGRYFPLKKHRRDSKAAQLSRLQPVVNKISAKLACSNVSKQITVNVKREGQRIKPIRERFGPHQTIEIVVSWVRPGTKVMITPCRVVNRNGKVIADLKGKGKRQKLRVRRVNGRTWQVLDIKRPKRGYKIIFGIKVVKIGGPGKVVIQIEPGGGASDFDPGGPGPGPDPDPDPPDPPTPVPHVVVVNKRVTNGMSMREDSTPTRLLTQPRAFCTTNGCNINGTERSTGQTYESAVCQTWGERITNGNDHSAVDDANPELYSSTRYYGVRLADGTFGYLSEVWVQAADRGGLWLGAC